MKISRWLLLTGFALLIFGGKLRLIDTAGSDLPVADQWDAIGESTLRPWLEGHLTAADLFKPHNEHRLITTKLYALGLVAANGQWDSLVETAANAAVHTLFALALLLFAGRWLRGGQLAGFGLLLVALFTAPFSWENTLYGFQVQFYFLLLFSLLHLWLTLESDRFTARWAVGQVCGLLAVASLASGVFSSAAILAVLALRFARERRLSRQQIATAGLAVVFCIAGWLMKTDVPGHAALRAAGPGAFLHGVFQLLAWPGSAFLPWTLAPVAVFIYRRIRSRELSPGDATLLGLFLWLVLQCAALACARGGGPGVLRSRYLDLLTVNLALGFIVIAREFAGRTRRWLAAAWLVVVLAGLVQESRHHWQTYIGPDIARARRREANVSDYLQTGNQARLLAQPPENLPYPDAHALIERLQSPALRAILPPSVRIAVPIASEVAPAPRALPAPMNPPQFPVAVSTWALPVGAGPFAWRSAVQAADALPILRFRVAGDLGADGRNLRVTVRSASGAVDIVPDSVPHQRWKNVTVFRPAGEWWIEATDADPQGWLAVSDPVELTRGTWFAEKVIKFNLVIVLGGAALLALGGLATALKEPGADSRPAGG